MKYAIIADQGPATNDHDRRVAMIKSTSDNQLPAAYELGKMFYRAGREYNPYQPDTPAFTEFYRGMLDAEEDELAAEIGSWDQPEE